MKQQFIALSIATLLTGAALAGPLDNQRAMPESTAPAATAPVQLKTRFEHPGFTAIAAGQSLTSGAKGEVVTTIQQTLIDMGYGIPAGATGYYGDQTINAVAAFQASRGLAATGTFDAATLASLKKTAPAPGLKLWEDPRAAGLGAPARPTFGAKAARALVDLSEHRVTFYAPDGSVERVFPVASGAWGTPTDTGIKVVVDRVADPSPIAWALWPESRGGAFGTRLLDLSWHDPATGATWGSGEEMHGTYVRDSIGTYASHGCIRMQNEDIEWVYQHLQVGDIVVVQN
ncbi:MAG: murein L,D-transpeptidase [Candidatus Eremiobacteraeota bacterium]|nr:murein L,D-transpeptidase [Candidatus Eremiobacteraeota bacterium]